MKVEISDQELIDRFLLHEDSKSYGLLYERYFDRVFVICDKYVKKREEALDLTQDVMIKLLDKLKNYKKEASFSTWFFRIVNNHCIDHLRKVKKKKIFDVLDDKEIIEIVNDEDDLDLETRIVKIENAIAVLAPIDKELLEMKYIQGLKIKVIAEKMSLKESSVKMKLLRLREKLLKVSKAD